MLGLNQLCGFGVVGNQCTVVLTSSDASFTIPTDVLSLDSAVGYGTNGAADYWGSMGYPFVRVNGVVNMGSTYGATLDRSALVSDINAAISAINVTGAPGERSGVSWSYMYYNYVGGDPATCTGGEWKFATITQGPFTIRGTASFYNPSGYPTSGAITSAYTGCEFDTQGLEWYVTGAAGTAATGFGESFPGGAVSGGTAPTTTFTKVAVTPGYTYPLSIPAGGQITIKYTR